MPALLTTYGILVGVPALRYFFDGEIHPDADDDAENGRAGADPGRPDHDRAPFGADASAAA
jgi:hypothetical protein